MIIKRNFWFIKVLFCYLSVVTNRKNYIWLNFNNSIKVLELLGIKMSLKSPLDAAKWMDEQVLRQHTKLTKKWEDRGHSRYTL